MDLMESIPKTPLKYLRHMLEIDNDFYKEWKRLSEDEKSELKKWAEEEIERLP
tara:strand:- start:120 stop:278 length:159 start_codon:yes stop_codon:yes gene_type:complete